MNESRGRVGGGCLCWFLETQDKAKIYGQGYMSKDPCAEQPLLNEAAFLSGCPELCSSMQTSCPSKFQLEELIILELFTLWAQLPLMACFLCL